LRKKGLGKDLLATALKRASRDQFEAVTLWTRKASFYERLGFEIHDNSVYGWVENQSAEATISPLCGGISGIRLRSDLPIPPFAKRIMDVSDDRSSCILMEDDIGPILADYSGGAGQAAAILKSLLPRKWRLNSFSSDPIIAALCAQGMAPSMESTRLQMWRSLNSVYISSELARMGRFTVLDRI
jgi:hypothetical protein